MSSIDVRFLNPNKMGRVQYNSPTDARPVVPLQRVAGLNEEQDRFNPEQINQDTFNSSQSTGSTIARQMTWVNPQGSPFPGSGTDLTKAISQIQKEE